MRDLFELLDEEEPGLAPTLASAPTSPAGGGLRAALVEQIVRDTITIIGDELFWQPSREFFVERIAMYKETVAEMDGIL